MFDDQVMGSDRGAKRNVAVDGLEGGDMSAEEDPFLAQRPSQGAAVALAPPQMIDSDDSDPQVLNRPRHGRVNSMLRPDATSLALRGTRTSIEIRNSSRRTTSQLTMH